MSASSQLSTAPETTAATLATSGTLQVDRASFRTVLSKFCSGIAVVTAHTENGPVGFTCQSFTSLSLSPPLVALCPSKTSKSWPEIARAKTFAINVLAHDQEPISNRFGSSGGDKFRGVRWHRSDRGAPLIDGVLAHIECTLVQEYDGGDHVIAVGAVEGLASSPGAPLLYFQGRYERLASSAHLEPS